MSVGRRRDNSGMGGADSVIGYRRPPRHSQFKPGTSGNPKGRPKQSKSLKSIIQDALTSKVTVRENGRVRSVSKIEAVVLSHVERALKGDDKAAVAVIRMAGHVDLLSGPEDGADKTTLSATEEKILMELFANQKPAKRGR